MNPSTEPTDRKVTTMSAWAEVLTRSAHNSLDRMDMALTRAEETIAKVRDTITNRDQELGLLTHTPIKDA
ncbi:hypothetical protein FTUN_6457 [Frigoriglobus tundricola]|uniref:Uncharacterized protein n=1 Tax=Frigoriglobus tundricola TaxID=2774151 RepID=A0A6M5Z0X6_9BACT|nr:hypothetical protein FTUN_6457 [Frigoriglobus tundricola]